MRPILSFCSVLAFGAMTSAALVALLPWFSGHAPEGLQSAVNGLQFNSLLLGLVLGLTLGTLGRLNWADVPRRVAKLAASRGRVGGDGGGPASWDCRRRARVRPSARAGRARDRPLNFGEKPLGVLATDEHLDRVAERVIRAASLVADDVDDHRGGDVTAASFVA